MEFLRKLIVQTRDHLKGLSLSQRVAIGCCVALIGMGLLWLVNWASAPALVPLLEQPMSAEDLGAIQQRLQAQGIPAEVSGDMILVPAEERVRLIAQLGEQRLLPDDISIGFTKLLEESSSPWLNMKEQDRRWTLALSNELARVLRCLTGVKDARVFIDKTRQRLIGQPSVVPTASVWVKLAEGEVLDRERIRALAGFVSRAVAGLDIHSVQVTDATSRRSGSVPKPDDELAYNDLTIRKQQEEYFANQIKGLLSHIPGLLVSVHAELDPESRHETKQIGGKPVLESDSSETESETRSVAAAEPGVNANVARSVAAGSPTESRERSVTESRYGGAQDMTVTTTDKRRHNLERLTASVNVPKSYLVSVYRPDDEDADVSDAELDKLSKSLLGKIKSQVTKALDVAGEDVEVAWFPDGAVLALADTAQAAVAGGMMQLVKTHWDKAGLGALAVVSLAMMLMMVRRVGEGPVLPGEEPPTSRVGRGGKRGDGAESMAMGEEPIGEARETEHLLVGKELDEATVRTRQVVEQVGAMIQEDPDASAMVLQRWVDASKQ